MGEVLELFHLFAVNQSALLQLGNSQTVISWTNAHMVTMDACDGKNVEHMGSFLDHVPV